MDLNAIGAFVQQNGLVALAIVGAGLFIGIRLFPWWSRFVEEREKFRRERQIAIDKIEAERFAAHEKAEREKDASYIEVIRQSATAIERTGQAIDKLVQQVNAQPMQRLVELITQHMDRSEQQHDSIMSKLGEIDRVVRG